ncbi:phosphopentomutase [Candidatus Formimonas warabiya]|uniref:Phosphopentomutase n=1 Tax=Formimonas warabiya TaxID=1761012 RepID=A0A3G1KNS2_FORW1|nr:phosphopentomutase [Candidatus Formimonas warabiya]ATW24076.1 phosphopentomutase [Candidatus Formimonas warabiya]
MPKRVILMILDSAGIGALPDASLYGDEGSNTLGNMARVLGGLNLPHLAKLGLGNISEILGVTPTETPLAAYGRMAERSPGKDTTTGHWEMSGIILKHPFPTYPMGFPPDLIARFEEAIGTKTLGNLAASGTEIIKRLGEEHLVTGYPIVYTSADSVFQIAAHEKIVPLERLYQMCEIARKLLVGPHAVGRVIARPFDGKPGEFFRTSGRHDFSLLPPDETMLDLIKGTGQKVVAIGKIKDIFAGQGITQVIKAVNNSEGINSTLAAMDECDRGLIFTNLVDFDMLYGHRNDPAGYANALAYFDASIPKLLDKMREEDLMIITADHGTDPTTGSTDHSREYVPLLICGEPVKKRIFLGTRETFADAGATIIDYLGAGTLKAGVSMLPLIQ